MNIRNLAVCSYVQGFTVWHYTATQPLEATLEPGYFNDANMLHPGDVIYITYYEKTAIRVVMQTTTPITLASPL